MDNARKEDMYFDLVEIIFQIFIFEYDNLISKIYLSFKVPQLNFRRKLVTIYPT